MARATRLYIFADLDSADVIAASSLREAKRIGQQKGSPHAAGKLVPGWIVPLRPRAAGVIPERGTDARLARALRTNEHQD